MAAASICAAMTRSPAGARRTTQNLPERRCTRSWEPLAAASISAVMPCSHRNETSTTRNASERTCTRSCEPSIRRFYAQVLPHRADTFVRKASPAALADWRWRRI
jgi:hypothetical protein